MDFLPLYWIGSTPYFTATIAVTVGAATFSATTHAGMELPSHRNTQCPSPRYTALGPCDPPDRSTTCPDDAYKTLC